jgi:hypothetical protein
MAAGPPPSRIIRLNVAPADELLTDERPPGLRAFPDQVPRGVRFFGSGDPT